MMVIKKIEHGSSQYNDMISLRIKVLLNPIGVPATYIDKEKEKNDILIGAFENEVITGCCVLTPKADGVVQLRQMAVRTDLQGKKIGESIIRFAELIAFEKGYSRLIMHARDTVIEFYKKSGYNISGNQFFEVGISHYLMEKKFVSS